MCGIVGYVGKKQALPILLEGIRNLEYRGYDSAGLAILGDTLYVEKAVGRVSNLEKKVAATAISGCLGIVHSRWATHGGVTVANAHPHTDTDGNIYVVHNGIIENFAELKAKLIKDGCKFTSETDTEVVAHLVGEIKRKRRVLLEEAVRLALQQIHGTYALAILDRREPGKLIAVRNFSPLVIGIGRSGHHVASDASAFLKHTRRVIYVNDGEMAILTAKKYVIHNLQKKTVRRKPQRVEWNVEEIQKGGYPHFMLKEIFEQPDALIHSMRGRIVVKDGRAVLGGLASFSNELKSIRRLLIVACGTAYLSGRVGEYMIEEHTDIPVEVDIASEFRYRKQSFKRGDALIVVSQSGETADTLAALREAKEHGIPTFGIVNVVGSTIARDTDAGVYQHIGPEIGVASTKAFLSQVGILALFTLYLGNLRGLPKSRSVEIARALKELPKQIEAVLDQAEHIKRLARKYKHAKNYLYLGRKYNYPVAMEGALKIKEIAYVHAEGMGAGEMKHGPIALIDRDFPSIFIMPCDSVYEKNMSNLREVKARNGPIIAVATDGDKNIAKLADDVIYIPETLEMLTPILSIVPLQLFAYYVAVLRGCDVDKPRNLAKSVTVE